MKSLGFRKLLLISIIALVVFSVSISSYVAYSQQKETLVDMITNSYQDYVESEAEQIEERLNEKVEGLNKLGKQWEDRPIVGEEKDFIELTHIMAGAMNLNSSVVAFTNGDGYWNQTAKTWPNNKYDGDITTRSWYQLGRQSPSADMTEPYLSSDGDTYWVSIVRKTYSGMISVDMQLSFLNQIVKNANEIPGAVAMIISHDKTVLASSISEVKAGERADKYPWLSDVAKQSLGAKEAAFDGKLGDKDKLFFSHQVNIASKSWYFVVGLEKDVVFADLASAKQAAITTAVIATVVSVVLALLIMNVLYRPILVLKETITGLSQGNGDLTQRIEVTTKDDLGQISEGVNAFIANLQAMMLEIRQVTDYLNENVDRLKDQSQRNIAKPRSRD